MAEKPKVGNTDPLGLIPLNVNLLAGRTPEEFDAAWHSSNGIGRGEVTDVEVYLHATGMGRPMVVIKGEMTDGEEVTLRTTYNLFVTAALALQARYGPPTDAINQEWED